MTGTPHTSLPEANSSGPAVTEIIFFGRLEERKGLIEFVDALTLLAESGVSGFFVTFLGKEILLYSSRTGRMRSGEYIRSKLEGQGFPYQILPDFSSQAAIAHVRQSRSAIVCLASPTDNFPNAGLEMAQVPVPLVLSDTIAFRQTQELVGRKEALFWFKPESAASLCTQLSKALEAAPEKVAVPEKAAIEAINEGLGAQRLQRIEHAFASERPFWPQLKNTVRVFILSLGDAAAIRASLRSLEGLKVDPAEWFVWSAEEFAPEVAADVKSDFPGVTFTQEITSPPPDGGPGFLLLVSAGVTLQPSCLENFVEAAIRSKAGLVASAEWAGPKGEKEVRTFTAGTASQLLRANRSSGACVLLSRDFYDSLPGPTADTPDLMIWQLTLAAAITGERTAYLPYPQYSTPAHPEADRAGALSEKPFALLSRYAAGIRPSLWARREIFGLAVSVQQLAAGLQRTRDALSHTEQLRAHAERELASAREALASAELLEAQARAELAAIRASGTWRLAAFFRHPRQGLKAFLAKERNNKR